MPVELGELRDQLRRERRGAGQDQPHRAEPLLEPVDVAPVGEDRRRDRDHAARLVLDQVEGALRLEAAGQHQLGAVPHHDAEHRVEPVDVEQRQHAEHHVVAVDHRRLDRGDLVDVREQRAVGQHRGARAARRTARVEERGELLGVLQRRDRRGRCRPAGGRTSARPAGGCHRPRRCAGSRAAPSGRPRSSPRGTRSTAPARGPGRPPARRTPCRRRRRPSGSPSPRSSGPAHRTARSGSPVRRPPGSAARRGRSSRTRSGCRAPPSPGGRRRCRPPRARWRSGPPRRRARPR